MEGNCRPDASRPPGPVSIHPLGKTAMMRSREILLQLLHDSRYSLSDAEVWYIDRGAPGNTSRVSGRGIVSVEAFSFGVATENGTKDIPYHRILRILHRGETLWERGMKRDRR
jgi:uncharacterized protein (UPF0248 family)